MTLKEKYNLLSKNLETVKGDVVVAFSGGVDSSLILKISKEICTNVTAVFMSSPFVEKEEDFNAKKLAEEIGVEIKIIQWNPLSIEEIKKNSEMRCYFCKKEMYNIIKFYSFERDIKVIFDGTNYEDLMKGYKGRPGLRALEEHNIRKPLAESYFTKSDVREMARILGLSNYNLVSKSCKATSVPFGIILDF